ncbi:MAG: acyl-CoA synthetase, partial [Rhizobiales bacterium]|nr:acyl-CoA synthetase [Hyphomicrobiales bacterium]
MLQETNNYKDLYENFSWEIPEFYNIGFDVCDKWAEKDPNKTAIISVLGSEQKTTRFGELKKLSNKTANSLIAKGVNTGDRVGILLPQSVDTAASHIAVYKMGAIAVPLFVLFGPSALEHRIMDAGIKLIITNLDGAKKLNQMSAQAYEQLTVLLNEDISLQDQQALNFQTFDLK